MNPGAAEHDSKKIKEESQNLGNKFDNAVDNAVDKAKAYSQDARKELKQTYEEAKTKAENFTDEASAEARKKFADAKADLTKAKEGETSIFDGTDRQKLRWKLAKLNAAGFPEYSATSTHSFDVSSGSLIV